MARLELPARAFTEAFLRRAFPERDWSQGSGINELCVKAFAVLVQPLRHEQDVTKINQSLANYQYMRESDLDALAANWGKSRRRGSRAEGTVRLYLDTAADYSFTQLQFVDDAGTTYSLTAPVTLTSQELLSNRRADGTYYADVNVASNGIGDRYVVPAGSIRSIVNRPTNIVSVENLEDFRVTFPNETNYDVVNSLYRNVGLKNLVNRSAIRSPLYDTFPGILDAYIAGVSHPTMVRDRVVLPAGNFEVDVHVGGCTDVWLNTNNVQQRELTLSYLPSSNAIDIVDATQAGTAEVVYTYLKGFVQSVGEFFVPGETTILDESYAVQLGIDSPVEATVARASSTFLWRLTGRDLVGGSTLLALPGGYRMTDPIGPRINTSVADAVSFGPNELAAVGAHAGRTFEPGPRVSVALSLRSTGPALVGERSIPLNNATSTGVRVHDKITIVSGEASGDYTVLGVLTNNVIVGRPVGSGTLTSAGVVGSRERYRINVPLPPYVDTTFSIYQSPDVTTPLSDPGYDQTAGRWHAITAVSRDATGILLESDLGLAGTVSIVGGLVGPVAADDLLYLHAIDAGELPNPVHPLADGTPATNILYAGSLDADFDGSSLVAPGIGVYAKPGDLVVFDSVPASSGDYASTGGDGTVLTVVITKVPSRGSLTVLPLGFTIPAGTSFAVVSNRLDLTSATVTTVSGMTATFTNFPFGMGDARGIVVVSPPRAVAFTVGTGSVSIFRTAGSPTALLVFPADSSLTGLSLRDTLVITGSSGYNGSYEILDVSGRAIVIAVPTNDLSFTTTTILASSCAATRRYANVITSTDGLSNLVLKFTPPRKTIKLTLAVGGHPESFIGRRVTQVDGAVTYDGVIEDIAGNVFEIAPVNPNLDLFVITSPISVAGYSTALTVSSRDDNGGAFFYRGYVDATVNEIVWQGDTLATSTSSGTVVSVDPLTYTWVVKPSNASSTFDDLIEMIRTDTALGILRERPTTPLANYASVTATFQSVPELLALDNVSFRSRFGLGGAMMTANGLQLNSDIVGGGTFAVGNYGPSSVILPIGDLLGQYNVTGVRSALLTLSNPTSGGVVRIPGAPPEQTLPIAPTGLPLSEAPLALTVPGIGKWAGRGRIVRLTNGTDVYDLIVSNVTGVDTVTCWNSFPGVTLYNSGRWTYEVLEGFAVPYMFVDDAKLYQYRAYVTPKPADPISFGTCATTENSNIIRSTSLDFTPYVSGTDVSSQEFYLAIDSGDDASADPYLITSVTSASVVTLATNMTATAVGVQFRLVRRANPTRTQGSIPGVITAQNKIRLLGPATRYYQSNVTFTVLVEPDAELLNTAWAAPKLAASYDSTTNELTLRTDVAAGPGEAWTLNSGFSAALIGQACRVVLFTRDQTVARAQAGQVVRTYNYYRDNEFFQLPMLKVSSVSELSADTLQPVADLTATTQLVVREPGLRYSPFEVNRLVISGVSNPFAPIRITYLTDPSIKAVNDYLTSADTEVTSARLMAKRMEVISVSFNATVTLTAQSTPTAVSNAVASYINTIKSTAPITKVGILSHLIDQELINALDLKSVTMAVVYYKHTGEVEAAADVDSFYGSETASYLANAINIRVA